MYICVPMERENFLSLNRRDKKEVINHVIHCILQKIDENQNYVWDMILMVCEYAVHCMDVADEYYRIVEVLYQWSCSKMKKTNLFVHFYTRIGSVLSAWNESSVPLSEHGRIIFYGNRNIKQLYKKIIRSDLLSDSAWCAHEQLWKDEKEYYIFSGP